MRECRLQTKSVSNTDIAWAYRVNYDDEQRDAVVFNEPMESVEVTIEANHNAFKRSVVENFLPITKRLGKT